MSASGVRDGVYLWDFLKGPLDRIQGHFSGLKSSDIREIIVYPDVGGDPLRIDKAKYVKIGDREVVDSLLSALRGGRLESDRYPTRMYRSVCVYVVGVNDEVLAAFLYNPRGASRTLERRAPMLFPVTATARGGVLLPGVNMSVQHSDGKYYPTGMYVSPDLKLITDYLDAYRWE